MTANALQKNVRKQLMRIGQIAKENFGSVSTSNVLVVLYSEHVYRKLIRILLQQFVPLLFFIVD